MTHEVKLTDWVILVDIVDLDLEVAHGLQMPLFFTTGMYANQGTLQ